jgi:hypothetical protein
LTIAEGWDEARLTWNNAPLALENVSTTWVEPLASYPGWPGVARQWDVSRAVAEAYAAGEDSLRLALYEADYAIHSGKYFFSSDADQAARPTLRVVWGDALEAPESTVYMPQVLKESRNGL